MTYEEYHIYSDMARKLFNYMNGNINKMNSNCTFSIEMYDYLNNSYGNIRYPNHICIYVGSIIDSWKDKWSNYINKNDYIGTCIAWAIAHELHHADQLISMMQYKSNDSYRDKVEKEVNKASYDWVDYHSREIYNICGFNVVIRNIDSTYFENDSDYKRASTKEFYLQTILNIVLRDYNTFNDLRVFTDDNLTDDIVIIFDNIEQIAIKSSGRYLDENINIFSNLVYKYAGYFDNYKISSEMNIIKLYDQRTLAVVKFNISDPLINGLIVKK